jgi:cell division protein FtsZ
VSSTGPAVTVVGVGGAGVNAVVRLRDVAPPGVRLVAADTSAQTLARAAGLSRVQLGEGGRGFGTGGDTRIGAAATVAAERELGMAILGADVVFIVAGMAGGTGGGAAPEVGRIARASGALAVGFGVLPWGFESGARRRRADAAWDALTGACDTVVPLDNARAAAVAGARVSVDVALRVADDIVRQAVQGLCDLTAREGWIGVDLAHVRRVIAGGGRGCLALALARGTDPAQAAMAAALESPLAAMGGLARSRATLAHLSGGDDLGVRDVAAALDRLRACLPAGGDLVVGVGRDPLLVGAAQVTVLGTGMDRAVTRVVPERRGFREVAVTAGPAWVAPGHRMPVREAPVRQAV